MSNRKLPFSRFFGASICHFTQKSEVVLDKQVVMAKHLDDFSGQVFVQNISFKSSGWVRFSL